MDGRPFPLAGLLIALATGGAVLASDGSPWVIGLAVLVWIATLWLASPAPLPPTPMPPEGVQLTRSGMREMIENSGLAMLMMDGERIIIANAAAREALGAHVVGQDARVAFRHPAAIDLLSRKAGGSATIQGLTGPRSSWQISRHPIDARYTLIELINRTAEADVSRAHTDFVANASHELRTPLASIIGYMETLTDEGEPVEPRLAAKFLGTVLREARRLQNLVEDLMSLSRIEAEKHDQPREPVELSALVRQGARDGAGPDRMDRLELAVPDAPLTVRGDRQQIEQLVRNLTDNALKYGDPKMPVTVSLVSDGRGMAVLEVRDRGEGIAPVHVPHLTRRFYRTDPARGRAAGGTGLGLAIVKHIVERHRGRLDIDSRQGEGTDVIVRLPLIADHADATSQ